MHKTLREVRTHKHRSIITGLGRLVRDHVGLLHFIDLGGMRWPIIRRSPAAFLWRNRRKDQREPNH